jgi:hypothetical protein
VEAVHKEPDVQAIVRAVEADIRKYHDVTATGPPPPGTHVLIDTFGVDRDGA